MKNGQGETRSMTTRGSGGSHGQLYDDTLRTYDDRFIITIACDAWRTFHLISVSPETVGKSVDSFLAAQSERQMMETTSKQGIMWLPDICPMHKLKPRAILEMNET